MNKTKGKTKDKCSVCDATLNPKPKIETPNGTLCLDCWAERMGSVIEKHPLTS